MRVQFKVLSWCIKKILPFFIILFCLYLLYIFSVRFTVNNLAIDDYVSLIGYSDRNFVSILLFLYQYSLSLYFTYIISTYEINNSLCNIILRENSRNYIISKILIIVIAIFLLRCFYAIPIYLLSFLKLNFPMMTFCSMMVNHLMLSLLALTMTSFYKRRFRLILLMVFSVFITFCLREKIVLLILVILLFIVFNIIKFSFKKIYFE